jgi:hypothetical protein
MSLSPSAIKKIYVDLASLLDIRLGTLITLDADFAFSVSSDPAYYTREHDQFYTPEQGMLSKENYLALQQRFPDLIVRNALVTQVPSFVQQLCISLTEKAVESPHVGLIEIEVNTYPHVFNDDEVTSLLSACIHHFSEHFSIQIVTRPLSNLDMAYVAERYYAMVMYNPSDWINLHQRQLQKGKFKDLTLYCPRINHGRAFNDEERYELQEKGTDIYHVLQTVMAPILRLEYLPVATFCAQTAINPVG